MANSDPFGVRSPGRARAAWPALLTALLPVLADAAPLRLDDLVAPRPGSAACWHRQYEPRHLARHTDQTVREMRLGIGFNRAFEGDEGSHSFGIDVLRRGESTPAGAGGLCYDTEDGISCHVDCDGGGFLLRPARSPGAVLLDMRHIGWLSLRECGEDEGTNPLRPPLTPGKDDKVFLLYPAACDD